MQSRTETELADALEALIFQIKCDQAATDLAAMATADLSMSQVRCLLAVAEQDGAVPIHTLAERLGLTVATAGRSVDRLVACGLVTRREDPEDRRVRRVALSAEGREVISGIDQSRRRALLVFVRSLPDEQAAGLLAALRPIAGPSMTPSDLEELLT